MYQIYLLSIVTILLSGIALAYDRLQQSLKIGSLFNDEMFSRPTFRLVLGVVTLLVGFFQFLTVAPGDVLVVGDLVPALTGILLGSILAIDYYRERSTVETSLMEALDRCLSRPDPISGSSGSW
ncbi:MAG: hypothetical protein V3S41_01670 [Spirochaetia bacterium]